MTRATLMNGAETARHERLWSSAGELTKEILGTEGKGTFDRARGEFDR